MNQTPYQLPSFVTVKADETGYYPSKERLFPFVILVIEYCNLFVIGYL